MGHEKVITACRYTNHIYCRCIGWALRMRRQGRSEGRPTYKSEPFRHFHRKARVASWWKIGIFPLPPKLKDSFSQESNHFILLRFKAPPTLDGTLSQYKEWYLDLEMAPATREEAEKLELLGVVRLVVGKHKTRNKSMISYKIFKKLWPKEKLARGKRKRLTK